jgi:hypothetical protein
MLTHTTGDRQAAAVNAQHNDKTRLLFLYATQFIALLVLIAAALY